MRLEVRQLVWGAAATAVALGALVGLIAIAAESRFDDRDVRILLTVWAALLCGASLLAGLRLVERGVLPVFGALLAVAAPIGFVLFALPIWDEDRETERWGRIVLSDFFLLVSGLIFASLRLAVWAAHRAVLAVVLGVATALAVVNAIGLYYIWTFSFDGDDSNEALVNWGGRALVALFLLAVLGFLLAQMLERLLSTPTSPTPAQPSSSARTGE